MNKNKKTIFPMGFGFWFLLVLFSSMIVSMFCLIIFIFIKNSGMYHNWLALVIAIITAVLLIQELLKIIKQGPVIFDEHNNIINQGKNPNFFPPFCVDCKEIMDYKFTHLMAATCIEFTLKNNKKIRLHCMQFTKKQACQILKEIQIRGGLQNKEIVIKFK